MVGSMVALKKSQLEEAVTPAQRQAVQEAVETVSALRDFILYGNAQRKDDFSNKYDANSRGASADIFHRAMMAEFEKQVLNDPAIGWTMKQYVKEGGGTFNANTFIAYLSDIRRAVEKNDSAALAVYTDTTFFSADYIKNVNGPLIALCRQPPAEEKAFVPSQAPSPQAKAVPTRQPTTEEKADAEKLAGDAADMFAGMVGTARWGETETVLGRIREMVKGGRKEREIEAISKAILEQLAEARAKGDAFEAAFLDSFERALRGRHQECADILNAFRTDREAAKLSYADYTALFGKLPALFAELLTKGYDLVSVADRYGPELTRAVHARMEKISEPPLRGITQETLGKRLAEVKKFVNDYDSGNGLHELDALISGWEKALKSATTNAQVLALHQQIPSVGMLEDTEVNVLFGRRTIRALAEGSNDFYRTIGKTWISRLETVTKSLRNETKDTMTSSFAEAMLKRANLDLGKLDTLLDAAKDANQGIPPALAKLDNLLRTLPLENTAAREQAIISADAEIRGLIKNLAGALAAVYPKADAALVERRLMIQFVVPSGTAIAKMKSLVDGISGDVPGMEAVKALMPVQMEVSPTFDNALLATLRNREVSAALEAHLAKEVKAGAIGKASAKRVMAAYAEAMEKSTVDDAIAAFPPEFQAFGDSLKDMRLRLREPLEKEAAGHAPLTTLHERNGAISSPVFLRFRNEFAEAINMHIGRLESGAVGLTTASDKFVTKSREDMAHQARAAFQNMPLEYAYGIYQMLNKTYKNNWAAAANTPEEMARICAMVANLTELPAPYASRVMEVIGEQVLKKFDDVSIALICNGIAGYSQSFINGDYYHLLARYYNTLPDKIESIFMDITMVQRGAREQGYDVRLRTPAEDEEYYELFVPGTIIKFMVPKRVFMEWRPKGAAMVAVSPDLAAGPAWDPDFFKVFGTFLNETMLQGNVNLPMPFIRIPYLLQNVGALAPDFLPPVGEYIAATQAYDLTRHHLETKTGAVTTGGVVTTPATKTETSTTTINASQEWVREGATATTAEDFTFMDGTGLDAYQKGSARGQNIRMKVPLIGETQITAFDVDYEQTGTALNTIGGFLSGLGPAGADTYMLFRRNQTGKDVTLDAHLYKRAANGSYIESDATTLTADQAQQLYGRAFSRPMQRLYAGGRIGPKTADPMVQLDGALLFSGPWTAGYTSLEQFQGAGEAVRFLKEWGEYVDYEHTRSGKANGAFGQFRPDNAHRDFWVGRLSAENLRMDETGRRRYYGEFVYMKSDDAEVKGFVGLAEDFTWSRFSGAGIVNKVLGTDFLGLNYVGGGGGRITREGEQAIETAGGGKIYGVSKDSFRGVVASALYKTYTEKAQVQLPVTELSAEAQTFYDQNPILQGVLNQVQANAQARQRLYELLMSTNQADINTYRNAGITIDNNVVSLGQGSRDWLRTYAQEQGAATPAQRRSQLTQMLVSAGARTKLATDLHLQLGTSWDILSSGGATFLTFEWRQPSPKVEDLEFRTFVVNDQKKIVPIIGGYGEFKPFAGMRGSLEAYWPPIGELRLGMPLEFAFGGGWLPATSAGFHGALRVPVTSRLTLGAATSLSTDFFEATMKRMQEEGMVGGVFAMPYSETVGFRLANIFLSGAFIHQNQETATERTSHERQLSITGGLNWLTTRKSLTGTLGSQYWEATMLGAEPAVYSRLALKAGIDYSMKTWRSTKNTILLNPALTAEVTVGRTMLYTPASATVPASATTTTTDWTFHLRFGTAFGGTGR